MTNGTTPEPISVLIADDEPAGRSALRGALAGEIGIAIIGESEDGPSTVDAIRSHRPDLVLLDVQMPGMDGFDVIEAVGLDAMPPVIFVTAYDAHALRAFDVNAIDYVLKPFTDARLRKAIARTRDWLVRRDPPDFERRLSGLIASIRSGTGHPARIQVRRDDSIFFIPVAEIRWIEAAGNLMRLHAGGRVESVRTTITALAEQLDPTRFVRVHRSAIVNLDFVKEIQPWFHGQYVVILQDGQQVRVGRRYREDLLRPLI